MSERGEQEIPVPIRFRPLRTRGRLPPAVVMLALLGALLAGTAAAAQADYPAVYRERKLPELAGATITSTGRQGSSLRDGIRIDLETPMAVQEVLSFYRKQMTPLGWKEKPPRTKFQSPMVGRTEFTKGTLTYSVTASRIGQKTKINLNLVEKY